MNKEQFSNNLIGLLKTRNISPESAGRVRGKKLSMMLVIALGLVVGAIAIATALFLLLDHDWSIYGFLDRTFDDDIVHAIPYFWIAVLGIAIWSVRVLQRSLNRGYRIRLRTAVFGAFGAMAILGVAFFALGLNREIHDFFWRHAPIYNDLVESNDTLWERTEDGLIAGTVIARDGDTIILRDLKGVQWSVTDTNAVYDPRVLPLSAGKKVKIAGTIDTNAHTVSADTIERWSKF